MQEELLNSVVNITKTRDVDSLEYSLASTLHEFLKCREIHIYRESKHLDGAQIERTLSLTIEGEDSFIWEEHSIEMSPQAELKSCLKTGSAISIQSKSGEEKRWFPISIQSETVGAIYINTAGLNNEKQVLVNALCRIYENYLNILDENERDKLTGLLNRQTFDKKIKSLMQKQMVEHYKSLGTKTNDNKRKKGPSEVSWLVMMDIDHFKKVNDTFGHVCGDEVLLKLSQVMSRFFRDTDLLFRFGGEEFVIVFEPASAESISTKLNDFLDKVRQTHFPFVQTLTVSLGYAKMSPYDFHITVLENADKALYEAKKTGRDRAVYFEDITAAIDDDSLGGDVDLF